ncbi:MAG: FdtA/QdtA family cupin domain-containing protein [Verrucomicrobiaceae bacterium]
MSVSQSHHAAIRDTKVRGVRLYEMPWIEDHKRGHLTIGNFGLEIPFVPMRYFITFGVPNEGNRGMHAHIECAQFLVSAGGFCTVMVDDGVTREEHLLDRPTLGILVPPMVWASEFNHSSDSRLLVFASHHYDPADYIRDYPEYLKALGRH